MQDLVEYIAKNIVTKPEAVVVKQEQSPEGINLKLTVDPTDMGLIIGKEGQVIKSIRRLLIVRAISENVRVNLELDEPTGAKPQATEK